MVRCFVLFIVVLAGGCTDPSFREPIRLAPHGSAVRANMAAHIINPNPPARTGASADARRTVLASDRYQKGEVKAPGEKKKRSLTGAEK